MRLGCKTIWISVNRFLCALDYTGPPSLLPPPDFYWARLALLWLFIMILIRSAYMLVSGRLTGKDVFTSLNLVSRLLNNLYIHDANKMDFSSMMTDFCLIGLWDRSCLKVFENLKKFHSLAPSCHTYIYPLI